MANRRVPDSPPSSRPKPPPAAKSVSAAAVPAEAVAGAAVPAKPRKRRTTAAKTQTVITATAIHAVTQDERRGMIALSAYLRAERRGFAPGGEAEDWLAAEKEIDALLSGGHSAAQ